MRDVCFYVHRCVGDVKCTGFLYLDVWPLNCRLLHCYITTTNTQEYEANTWDSIYVASKKTEKNFEDGYVVQTWKHFLVVLDRIHGVPITMET